MPIPKKAANANKYVSSMLIPMPNSNNDSDTDANYDIKTSDPFLKHIRYNLNKKMY